MGYDWAYSEFYRWASIARASLHHGTLKHQAKHFFYAAGWKKFEPLWDMIIRARQLTRVTPLLEAVLSASPAKSRSLTKFVHPAHSRSFPPTFPLESQIILKSSKGPEHMLRALAARILPKREDIPFQIADLLQQLPWPWSAIQSSRVHRP